MTNLRWSTLRWSWTLGQETEPLAQWRQHRSWQSFLSKKWGYMHLWRRNPWWWATGSHAWDTSSHMVQTIFSAKSSAQSASITTFIYYYQTGNIWNLMQDTRAFLKFKCNSISHDTCSYRAKWRYSMLPKLQCVAFEFTKIAAYDGILNLYNSIYWITKGYGVSIS